MSRLFSDVGQVESAISGTIREGIFQALSVGVSAVVLLTLDPLLGVIVIVGAPLVGLVYRVMSTGAQQRSLAVQEELGGTYTVASENYGAQAVVKAFGLEGSERDRFGQASERLFAKEVKLQLFGGLFGLSVNMIVTVLQVTVLGLGSWLILHDRLTIGGLVAFSTVMGQVISPVTALTGIGQQIQASTGSLLRINEVIDTVPDIVDSPSAAELAPLAREVRFDHVDFSYTQQRSTLEDVSFVIPAGTRVAFVGPTGAGKSSVLQLIMRFYDVDDGAVLFDGHDARDVTLSSLRGQLGIVFQDTFLFDATLRENIAMGKPAATDAEIEAAARVAELHEFVETLPRGYNTLVGERGGRLSGGQRQRLAIARALLRDPRVLLLDEATSALDPRTERLISDTLERVGKGRTTIAVTHRLTSITGFDQIFVMSAGHLVERGTHAELVALAGVYAELWTEQTGGIAAVEAPFDAISALRRSVSCPDCPAKNWPRSWPDCGALISRPGRGSPTIPARSRSCGRAGPACSSPGLDGRSSDGRTAVRRCFRDLGAARRGDGSADDGRRTGRAPGARLRRALGVGRTASVGGGRADGRTRQSGRPRRRRAPQPPRKPAPPLESSAGSRGARGRAGPR